MRSHIVRFHMSVVVVCWLMHATSGEAQTVQSLNLVTNHILYEPVSGKIYATVPSSAGYPNGNSIATIDPATATILRYVFIGSEPNPLAASDDGQFLYAGLDGADAVRRYVIATHTAGLQFSLGSDPNFGPYHAVHLKVLPGAPHAIAVSRTSPTNVAVYDDGVQRPNIVTGSMDSLAFSNSAAVLYAQDTEDSADTLFTLAVDAHGVSQSSGVNDLWGEFGGPIVFDANTGRIIDTVGRSADPQASALSGTFSTARLAYTGSGVIAGIVPDSANGRVFFLIYDEFNQGSTVTVAAFDPATFLPIGSLVIPNVLTPGSFQSVAADLVPWGTDGLAFRTSDGQIWLISGRSFPGLADFKLSAGKVVGGTTVTGTVTLSRPAPPNGAVVTLSSDSSLANPPASVTVAAGQTSVSFSISTSSGTQDVNLRAAYGVQYLDRSLEVVPSAAASVYPTNVRVIHLETNDLVFDPFSQLIYASVPSSVVGIGNSITTIHPFSGRIGTSVFVGSEPYRLAISGNGTFIYAGLFGAAAIRRFDPPTQTAELQYSLGNHPFFGPYFPGELVVLPGEPHALAVSRVFPGFSPSFAGVPIYDDAVARPNVYTGFTGGESITPGATAGRLYGYDNETTEFEFDRFNVDSTGITLLDNTNNLITGFGVEITYQGGFVFATDGKVIDPEARTLVGTFENIDPGAALLPDVPDKKVYFVDTDNSGNTTLRLYDPNVFLEIAAFPLPGVQGYASSLVKWSTDHVAFRTSGGQVFLVNVAIPVLSKLTITPSTVVGGTHPRPAGTVWLSNAAPVGGVVVSLVSSNPSVASVPSSVTVPAGKQIVQFPVTTSKVSSQKTVTVTAKYKSTKSVTMTINP
jgi:hypothetical protein